MWTVKVLYFSQAFCEKISVESMQERWKANTILCDSDQVKHEQAIVGCEVISQSKHVEIYQEVDYTV